MLTTNGGIVTSLPITRKVAPVSPKERVKDRITPVKIPLFNSGREIDSAGVNALAPRVIDASSVQGNVRTLERSKHRFNYHRNREHYMR